MVNDRRAAHSIFLIFMIRPAVSEPYRSIDTIHMLCVTFASLGEGTTTTVQTNQATALQGITTVRTCKKNCVSTALTRLQRLHLFSAGNKNIMCEKLYH